MPVNQENGVSVYCNQSQPIEARENSPLYKSVRELVGNHSRGGVVLDIGCNDLVASRSLGKDFRVVGIDIDATALADARTNAPQIPLIQADATSLPIKRNEVDIVLVLDVLEHLTYPQARNLLSCFSQTDARMIVSMPVISPFSISSNKELLGVILAGQRPAMGLYDRTHQILTDQRGHRQLFDLGAMRVIEEFTTNRVESVSGEWKWKEEIDVTVSENEAPAGIISRLRRFRGGPYHLITFDLIPRLVHPADSSKRRGVTDMLIAYQGLYVLEGKNA